MLGIEETENLIRTMRTQARALDAGADALEAAIAPFKNAMAGLEAVSDMAKTWAGLWEAMAKSAVPASKQGG